VFITVYRLEIQSVINGIFEPACELLPLSPTLWFNSPPLSCVNKFTIYTYTVCKGVVWGYGPQTDKHLPKSLFSGQFFQLTAFCIAFFESYLSTSQSLLNALFFLTISDVWTQNKVMINEQNRKCDQVRRSWVRCGVWAGPTRWWWRGGILSIPSFPTRPPSTSSTRPPQAGERETDGWVGEGWHKKQ
jgi:hypothetical protein